MGDGVRYVMAKDHDTLARVTGVFAGPRGGPAVGRLGERCAVPGLRGHVACSGAPAPPGPAPPAPAAVYVARA